jgi:hypothetical protein
MTAVLGQPSWIAMGNNALALGIGAGEDAKLAATLKDPAGDAGQMTRMHLSGAMYLQWLQLMEQKVDTLSSAAATIGKSDQPTLDGTDGDATSAAELAANAARSKAQFEAMKAEAKRIDSIDAEMHVDDSGMVITSQTVLK